MEKQLNLVSFGQAQRLKKAGFDWDVEKCYSKNGEMFTCKECGGSFESVEEVEVFCQKCFSAPTFALALKWFRDEKGINIGISYAHYTDDGINIDKWGYDYSFTKWLDNGKGVSKYGFTDTYELAESALLDELLTVLEAN